MIVKIIPVMTTMIDSQFGAPLRFSQNIGVAAIVAMKTDSKKGTNKSCADFMPATMIKNAASWIRLVD